MTAVLVFGAVVYGLKADEATESDATTAAGAPGASGVGPLAAASDAPGAGGAGAFTAVGAMEQATGSPAASSGPSPEALAGDGVLTDGEASGVAGAPSGGGRSFVDVLQAAPVPDPPEPVGWVSTLAESSSGDPVLPADAGGLIAGDTAEASRTSVEAASATVDLIGSDGDIVDVAAVGLGSSPVSLQLAAERPGSVGALTAGTPALSVRVLDDQSADWIGADRVAFVIEVGGLGESGRPDGVSAAEALETSRSVDVTVRVDYGDFVDEFGADWAGRLRLVRMEPCTLERSDGCPGAVVVDGFVNDREANEVSITLPLSDLVPVQEGMSARSTLEGMSSTESVFALAAGGSSQSGDYETTSLNPTGSWSVGGNSGDFSWSYPIEALAPPAGAAPALSVSYSSGAIDGMTSDQNTQGGVLGPGWALSEGFVERQYTPCAAIGGTVADMCWAGDNATFSFQGMNDRLIRVGAEASFGDWTIDTYRLESHSGWIVKRMAINGVGGVWDQGALGVDDNREYFQAISPDGTKYWFGYGHESGDFDLAAGTLGSLLTVPVVGMSSGNPCNTQSSDWCHQGYRWMLDRVEDANGRVTTFRYARDTNYYGRQGYPTRWTPYVAGAVLASVEYGQLVG